MKKLLPLLFLLPLVGFGQNLVPNPSFEDTVECIGPFDLTLEDWVSFKGSPDYASYDCTPYVITEFGNLAPHAGNAYAGFITYGVINPPDAREFIGVELISPLSIGETYFLSFFLAPGYTINGSYNVASNNVGMLFTTYPFSDPSSESDNFNFSHFRTEEIISDVGQWVKVSGSFIADSAYSHLVIGNFYDDEFTDTVHLPSATLSYSRAYMLIDDVCVATDSLYNETWTVLSVPSIDQFGISVYPNPAAQYLRVKSDRLISSVRMIDSYGKTATILDAVNDDFLEIPVHQFKSGLYVIEIIFSDRKVSPKILIQK